MSFDGLDGWTKRWALSNSNRLLAKRNQQRDGSVMKWAGIFVQTIIESFKIEEGVQQNIADYCDFMDDFLYTVQIPVSQF